MEDKLSLLKTAKYIWVYGIGNIGKQVVKVLSNHALQISLEGIVVSERGKEEEYGGYKINEISEINTPDRETLFIISASKQYQKEIIDNLLQRGYSQYIVWERRYINEIWRTVSYQLDDRRKRTKRACFVLSGYKEFLWDNVFERLKQFAPKDLDICILSSGTRSEKLARLAQQNQWSYLSTETNDVCLIQNLAAVIFSEAEWIYKMDEDIFVTEGCFERVFQTHLRAEREAPYHVGFSAPLINVNGYGYIRILERLQKLDEYENLFGRAFYGADSQSMIEKDIEAARYMWGEEKKIPQIDKLSRMLHESNQYGICSTRFSIGFILMRRRIWEDMGGYAASGELDMGADERQLCQYCIVRSLVTLVAENTVVGHFAFGNQTEGMRELYRENRRLFQIQ